MTLQRFLTRWIWLCVSPLVLLAAYLAYDNVRTTQAERDLEAATIAQNFAALVDQGLRARIGGLQILAVSPHVDRAADWRDLYREAQSYRETFGSHVILADLRMRMLLNTRVPLGAALPKLPTPKGHAAAPMALETRQPAVGDMFIGPVAHEPLVAVAVPGMRSGKVAFLLLSTFDTRYFQSRIERESLPAGWSLALIDGNGNTIARTPPGFDAGQDADSGRRFVAKSRVAPWSAVLEISRDVYRAPVVSGAIALVLSILAITLISIVGGMFVSRRLARSVASLAEAPAPGANVAEIAEISVVRRLLDEAAQRRSIAEEARHESEDRYRDLVENSQDLVCTHDLAGKLISVNLAAHKALGYETGSLVGRNLREFLVPGTEDRFSSYLDAMRSQGWAEGVLAVRTAGGEVRHWEFRNSLRRAGSEEPIVRGMARDITERTLAERALHQSERRFRATFEQAAVGISLVAPDGRWLQVNQRLCEIVGYSQEELLARSFQDITHPEDVGADLAAVPRLLAGEIATYSTEKRYVRKDGAICWINLTVALVRHADGSPDYFVAVIEDIQRRKQAEDALRTRESELREAQRLARVGNWTLDLRSGNRTWSEQLYRIHGRDPSQPPPTYAELEARFTPETWAEFAADLEAARVHGTGFKRDAEVLRGDGMRRWITTQCEATRDADGRVIELHGTVQDITERKEIEFALRAAEEKFRGLVEQSIAGIYLIQDGKFVYVNPRYVEIFGYDSADELIGREALSLVAESDRAMSAEKIRQRMDGETVAVYYTFKGLRKDGAVIDMGVHGTRATHAGRTAIIGMVQDISEKKRAEEQIQRYVTQLETAFMSTVEVATTLGEMRDPYTAGHQRRVAEIAVAIGAELGFDSRRQEGLRVTGYLHDIGKIQVPSEFLSKPGKLTSSEVQLIREHARAGYEVLKGVQFPWPVAEVALQHHERMDGSGYPQGLKGDAILLEARIIAVADVMEAMSTHRPYRPALGVEAALAEIERGCGKVYDAEVAAACLRIFREKDRRLPI